MNLAAIWNLPVIFALENNHFAVSTPIEESSRIPDLHKRAEGYGVMNDSVDGNDVLEVFDKTQKARALCLDGKGPVLLEFKTYRHGGHHVNDPGQYMPKDKLDYYMGRDPLLISRNYLGELGGVSEEEIAAIDTEVDRLMDDAILFAEQSPEPSVEAFLDEVANN
jgi:pyruvate dehydrogenase E1 component alpha subunit